MSKCELEVELEEPERGYRCGETVAGRVRVRTDGEVICKQLVIEQVWRTHGRGNQDQATFVAQVESDQRWLAGQVYEVPFRFAVPAAPISHHGQLVNVDHYVTARADLPWKIDPRAAADYLVVAGAQTPARYVETEADFEKVAVPEGAKTGGGSSLLLKILFAPIAIVLGAMVVVLLLALLVILLPILLVVLVVRLVRQGSAERRLGAVEVVIDAPKVEKARPDGASPGWLATSFAGLRRRMGRLGGATYLVTAGRPVALRLRFTPKSEVPIERVELRITATESARSGSGTNATTHTHVLVEEIRELCGTRRLLAGQPVELSGELALPPDAAASFKSSDNSVTWEMKVAIAIPQWPDWVQKNTLLVVPPAPG